MQAPGFRYLFLAAVLAAGAGLYATVNAQPRELDPRWPAADEVFTVDSWSSGPPNIVHSSHNTDIITRVLTTASGRSATLTLITNKEPKLYGPGGEVPLLGSGYQIEEAPPDVLANPDDGIHGLIARQDNERWLMLYAYGERRGLLGNGLRAWSLAIFDGILSSSNDYYKMYLVGRADLDDGGRDIAGLARALFPRVAAWYAG